MKQLAGLGEISKLREAGVEVFARTRREGLPKIEVSVLEQIQVGRLKIENVGAVVEQQPVIWTRIAAPNPKVNVNLLPILRDGGETGGFWQKVSVYFRHRRKQEHLILTFKPQVSVGLWTFELIGGYGRPGETPEMAAERELKEETGFVPGKLQVISPLMGNFPGRLGWVDVAFLAEKLTFVGKTSTEPEERHMKIIMLTPKELVFILENHQVISAMSQALLYRYLVNSYLSHTPEFQALSR